MKSRGIKVASGFLILFVLWTVFVKLVDVQIIGPRQTSVGFATINGFIHGFFGVNMHLCDVTDWLGLVPICFMLGFAVLGLVQWIKRRNILMVDFSIIVLGVFYIAVVVLYILFEAFPVNFRPVLIDGYLEASYPSSTTLLVLCVMPTSIMQLRRRISNCFLKWFSETIVILFIVFMVIGRLISGVHWFSDIVGAVLISAGFDVAYFSVCENKA